MPSVVASKPVSPPKKIPVQPGPSSQLMLLADFVKGQQPPSCGVVAPTGLQPPIELPETACRSSSAFLDAISARRRVKPSSRSPHQRHLLTRATSQHPTSRSPVFDSLPWISALDAPSDCSSVADFADLAQLAVSESHRTPSGPGPVRRRKTSLRSSPLRSVSESSTAPILPAISALSLPRETFPPPTPAPRFNPSRTIFRHLMPVPTESCQTVFSKRTSLFEA